MVTILIPVYNEHEGIASVVDGLVHKMQQIGNDFQFEIIIINDNSDNATVSKLEKLNHPVVKIIENIVNMGYGYSLKKGIQYATYDTILIIDGDGSYPIENIDKLLNLFKKGFDLVVASRGSNFSEDSVIKSIFRRFLRFIVEFSGGIKIPDVNSGMRIFSKTTIQQYVHLLSDRFSFTTSMTLLYALDRKLIHFEENGYNKRTGKSKVHLRKDILRTLQIIVEIIALKNPLKLHMILIFLSISVFALFSMVYYCIYNYFESNILMVFFLVLFIQFSFAAYAIQNKYHQR